MKLFHAASVVAILMILFIMTSCVSKKTYQQSVGLAAIAGYTAGINDCGGDVTITAENMKKRIDTILNPKKGDRP